MEILFLGTGPAKPTEERTNSSVLINSILIDCTPQFLKQAEREGIKKQDIKAVMITHAHKDAIGGLGDLDKWLESPIKLYAPENVNVNRFIKKFKNLEVKKIKAGASTQIEGNTITPFKVIHYEFHPTLGKKYPTYGYLIDKIVYAEDMESIPEESEKYFQKAETILADGAMWFNTQIRGHLSVDKTVKLAKRFEPKRLVIMQAGRTYPSQIDAEKEIQNYWDSIKGPSKTDIILAYDGLRMELKGEELEIANLKIPGIYLLKPHAELIWNGSKKVIIQSKEYENMLDTPMYYLDDEKSYGILRLKNIKPINLGEFERLKDMHQITEMERKSWWEEDKILYAYEFEILARFEDPKPVDLPFGIQTFVSDVKFMEEKCTIGLLQETGAGAVAGTPFTGYGLQPVWIWGKREKEGKAIKLPHKEIIKLIQEVTEYNPEKVNNNQLADDWRIVNAWYSTYKETNGQGIKFSKETIVNLAKIIYDEIIFRVNQDKMKHEFEPEKMNPPSLELYKLVSKNKLLSDWRDLKFLNDLQDFEIIKDCISLIGSSVTQESKPNDIDFLIRLDANEFMKRAIETRICKLLPQELQSKAHFVWGEKEGPHDSYIPLFDLHLKKINPSKIVTMAQNKIELMKPIIPQKPIGSAYYDLNKFLELFK